MNDRLHGALWGVTLQNNTVSFFWLHRNLPFFLLGWGNYREASKKNTPHTPVSVRGYTPVMNTNICTHSLCYVDLSLPGAIHFTGELEHTIKSTNNKELLFINFHERNFKDWRRSLFRESTRLSSVFCRSWVTWFVNHMCLPPPAHHHLHHPHPSPPIVDNPTGATGECFTWHQLKSVSGETVVRETVREGGCPEERQSHRWIDTQRCPALLLRGPCVRAHECNVCACVYLNMCWLPCYCM